MLLEVEGLKVSYDGVRAIHDASFQVDEGEVVCIVGSNGAGKTTLLKAVSGLLAPDGGHIRFGGTDLSGLSAHEIVRLGIAHVPEGRRLFPRMTVQQNLIMGAFTVKDRGMREQALEHVFELFPVLGDRRRQLAGTMSGGEQQMLAIARGLMCRPRVLLLDEPSLGLMPRLVTEIFEMVERINRNGTTVVLVEQNVREALELAHRGYVLQTGRVIMEGTGEELLDTDLIRRAYLGI